MPAPTSNKVQLFEWKQLRAIYDERLLPRPECNKVQVPMSAEEENSTGNFLCYLT